MTMQAHQDRTGLAMGAGAYAIWGLLPLYLKPLRAVPGVEVLAHRVLWSLILLVIVALLWRRGPTLLRLFKQPRLVLPLFASSLLIGLNWLIYIHGVDSGQVLATSLGYFINPLVNVGLAVVVLRERLRPAEAAGVALAALGVVILAVVQGSLPWISLGLALSFASYGLIRKLVPVDALEGLLMETLLLAPLALGYVLWAGLRGDGHFGTGGTTDLLLAGSGIITATPLLMFATAARRIRFAVLGLLQYIAPSMQFLLALFVFGERLRPIQFVTFGLIWLGLILFAGDLYRRGRASGRAAAAS